MCVCCGNQTSSCLLDPSPVVWKNNAGCESTNSKGLRRGALVLPSKGMGMIRLDGISPSPPGVFSKGNLLKMMSTQVKYSFYPKFWEVFLQVVEKLPGSTDWSVDVVSSIFSEICLLAQNRPTFCLKYCDLPNVSSWVGRSLPGKVTPRKRLGELFYFTQIRSYCCLPWNFTNSSDFCELLILMQPDVSPT